MRFYAKRSLIAVGFLSLGTVIGNDLSAMSDTFRVTTSIVGLLLVWSGSRMDDV